MTANAVPTTQILSYLNPVFRILGGDDIGGLPKGVPSDAYECVIARAFEQATGRAVTVGANKLSVFFRTDAAAISREWNGCINYSEATDADGTHCYEVGLPQTLIDFVAAFDNREYTALIDGFDGDDEEVLQPADGGSEAMLPGGGTGGGAGGAPSLFSTTTAGAGSNGGTGGMPALSGGSESGGGAIQPALVSAP